MSAESTPVILENTAIPVSIPGGASHGPETISLHQPSLLRDHAILWATLVLFLMIFWEASMGGWRVVLQHPIAPCFIWLEFFVICRFGRTLVPLRVDSHGRDLTLSPQGLQWHRLRKPRRQSYKPWSDVRFVYVKEGGLRLPFARRRSTVLVIDCAKVPDYEIDLAKLTSHQVEQLFKMIARFIPQDLLSPEALYLQLQSLCGSNDADLSGFTQVWTEEFNRRFELANHITLQPGQTCGNERYTVTMLMSTRVSSSTYLANDPEGDHVLLKELVAPMQNTDAASDKIIEQFEREALILATLDHPSIVKIKDHFVENGRSYIVMDYVSGRNLREHVRLNGKMSEAAILDIALQLAQVLDYMHQKDPPLMHRDLTPDNIIFSAADGHIGHIKVVDFGAANLYQMNGTSTLVGKQSYMAPEQYKGKPAPASDVYACGATMFYLLTGEDAPGLGKDLPEFLDGVGQPMRNIIIECMHFEAEDRPSARQLADKLSSLRALVSMGRT